jgi:mitochondrial import receptor subunit TOM40
MGTSSSKEAQALQSKLVDQVLQNLLSKDSSSNVTTQTNRRNHETHLYNNINISTARQDSSFQYPSMMMPLLPYSTMSFFLSPSTVRCDAPPLPPPIMDSSAPPPPPSPKNDTSSSKDDTTNNTSSTTQQQQQLYMTKIPNPGPYESASYPSKRLTSLETQDGFRMDIQKQLSPYMVAIHSFWLGTNMLQDGRNKTYSFVTQVADENGLYMARLDPERGTIDGRIQRAILGGLAMAKLQFGVSAAGLGIGQSSSEGGAASEEGGGGGGSNDQLLGEVDFGGLTWTGNLKYGSMGGGIIFGFNY